MALSEDSFAQLMDLESEKVTQFKVGSHEGSILNATIDPNMKYLATTGCDGMLHILNLETKAVVKKIKICKKQTRTFGSQ